ncbi:discoidin domain-containing protein [Kitasatospora misakiensis]|uniref:Discoidin domain-containing protein n=1 Tax=Kitasatospora misakiensis TaxID=67330 RepID=A0ABW0X6B3_9ACTN
MRKTPIRVSIAASACLLLAAALPGGAAAAAAPSVWVADGADHVFSSSPVPERPANAVTLFAARNEVQAAQIAVRSSATLTSLSVRASDLTGPGGAVIPSSRITVRREYDHPNVDVVRSGHQQDPPGGGTHYYDALVENAIEDPLAANTTQPFHYSVAVPTGQAPGTYTGRATVESSAGPVDVPVSVTVYDVELPPANRSTFRMNNWFTSAGWDYDWTARSIPEQYVDAEGNKVEAFSEAWWTLMGNFAKNLAKHRNNVVFADFQGLSLPDTTIVNEKPVFTWKNFDRFVQLFQDAGALQYIYTPHLLESNGKTLEALVDAGSGDGKVKLGYLTPGSPEATSYVDAVLPQLKAHLDTKCLDAGPTCAPGRRWSDAFYLSAVDEPNGGDESAAAAAVWLYERYHAVFPQGLSNEAHHAVVPSIDAALGSITPVGDNHYDANAGYYQSRRLAGKDLWLYYCTNPKDGHLNRYISYPLADSRLTPWMVSAVGGKGFLHWGWNIWTNDRTHEKLDTFGGTNDGDYYLVRPNNKDGALDVYDSMRSEALLAGIQDYELLGQLAAVKPVLARALTSSLITSTTEFTTSGAEISHRHKQILDALTTAGPDASYPFVDDFSSGGDTEWRHIRGDWSVTGDQAYVQGDPAADWDTVSGVAGRTYGDVAASVDVRITGVNEAGGDTNWAGLTVHSQNPTDRQTGYLVALRNNGEVFVQRSGATLGTATVPGYTPGQAVSLRVLTRGSTLEVYAGATRLISLTDASYPVGNVGLATGGASARFDDVRLNPGTNPAEGAAVTASSSYEADGWGRNALTDGRRSLPTGTNGWSSIDNLSTDHTESVTVDLGARRRISRLDLYGRADGANTGLGFPVDFTVQVSADNANWTTVADERDHPRPDASAQSFPFAPTDVRYVKVTGTRLRTDPAGNYHMQLAEIEAAGENLAANRPVTASSSVEAEGWRRTAATDGVRNSAQGYSMGWSSLKSPTAAANEWISVDLQSASLVSEVRLTPRTDGANTGLGFPVDFTVQVSPDNVNWTTVADRRDQPRPGAAAQVLPFAPTTARYVRITGTRLGVDQFGDRYMQLGEIGVS